MATGDKAPGAFKTIGELSRELGVAQHILRYWEAKFPQLRPLQRAGNRRYYRPDDVALARRINRLLNEEGYTVRGVQKLLGKRSPGEESGPEQCQPRPVEPGPPAASPLSVVELIRIRDRLLDALDD